MRLALVFLYAHFFFSGTLANPAANHTLTLDLASPQCTRIVGPLVVASQVFDLINTRNQFSRYPDARERDWWTSRFAGAQGRSIAGIAVGMAVLDYVKWRLSARSPTLRCALEANQFETTVEAIRATHPR